MRDFCEKPVPTFSHHALARNKAPPRRNHKPWFHCVIPAQAGIQLLLFFMTPRPPRSTHAGAEGSIGRSVRSTFTIGLELDKAKPRLRKSGMILNSMSLRAANTCRADAT